MENVDLCLYSTTRNDVKGAMEGNITSWEGSRCHDKDQRRRQENKGEKTRLRFRFVILLRYIIDSGQAKKQRMLVATRSGEMSHPPL